MLTTSYSRSVRQIEGQGVILWHQVMVRIRKILKIKNKHVILESAFLWVSATTDSADSGCNSVNSADSANSDPNSADSDPTRPTKYKIGHPSRVASRVSSAGCQLGLGLSWFIKHCFLSWLCVWIVRWTKYIYLKAGLLEDLQHLGFVMTIGVHC